MNIIAHCVDEISELLTNNFKEIENGALDFSTFVKNVEQTMRNLSVDLVEDVMEKTEESIFSSPHRKDNYRVQRSNDEKVISTIIGDVTLNRRYYQHKEQLNYIYLLDDFLGLEPHQRIDGSLEEDILRKASDMSYQKTIDSYQDIGIHSRMTVKNIVHKYEAKSNDLPTGEKRVVPYLYIEADEDHEYCGRFLPARTKFVLDPFHVSQSLKRAAVGVPQVFSTLHTWVKNDQLGYLEDYFDVRLADEQLSKSSRKLLTAQRTYLRRHWEAIQSQKDEQYISCSAEGHVSHYLSARLSSRPMGWSNTGADHMAKLRMYILNDGSLTALIENKTNKQRKERKIQQLDRRVSSKHRQAYAVIQGKLPILEHSTDTMLRKGFSSFKGL